MHRANFVDIRGVRLVKCWRNIILAQTTNVQGTIKSLRSRTDQPYRLFVTKIAKETKDISIIFPRYSAGREDCHKRENKIFRL